MSRYGAKHRALRAQWDRRMAAGEVVTCRRCGKPIQPGQSWDLGHLDGSRRDEHSGPEHSAHNRATNTHRAAARKRPPERHPGMIGD